jgi:hypothetical protein
MEKAILYCPREKLFVNNLLVEKPGLPGYQPIKNALEIQVDILEIQDEQALVRLPEIMTNGDKNTALVNVKYLN